MDPIYRIPPFILGPQVYTAAEAAEIEPWSILQQGVREHWKNTMGEGITVAVLDTGLWNHPDLPAPVAQANFSQSKTILDRQGHGTHVAGTIRASFDGKGTMGYAPKCNLACYKVLGDDGSGTSRAIAQGIYRAVDDGADIINMSLGGGYDRLIEEAIQYAFSKGVLVICAAGNEGKHGNENTVGYPARLPEAGAIASYNRQRQISEYSSRGPEVDVAFPGEAILSTWLNNGFREISGTSMAAPAASGLSALMLSWRRKNPETDQVYNTSDLKLEWQRSSIDIGTAGRDNSSGWGIVDAGRFIYGKKPETDPPAVVTPTGPEVKVGNCRVVSAVTLKGDEGMFVYG